MRTKSAAGCYVGSSGPFSFGPGAFTPVDATGEFSRCSLFPGHPRFPAGAFDLVGSKQDRPEEPPVSGGLQAKRSLRRFRRVPHRGDPSGSKEPTDNSSHANRRRGPGSSSSTRDRPSPHDRPGDPWTQEDRFFASLLSWPLGPDSPDRGRSLNGLGTEEGLTQTSESLSPSIKAKQAAAPESPQYRPGCRPISHLRLEVLRPRISDPRGTATLPAPCGPSSAGE